MPDVRGLLTKIAVVAGGPSAVEGYLVGQNAKRAREEQERQGLLQVVSMISRHPALDDEARGSLLQVINDATEGHAAGLKRAKQGLSDLLLHGYDGPGLVTTGEKDAPGLIRVNAQTAGVPANVDSRTGGITESTPGQNGVGDDSAMTAAAPLLRLLGRSKQGAGDAGSYAPFSMPTPRNVSASTNPGESASARFEAALTKVSPEVAARARGMYSDALAALTERMPTLDRARAEDEVANYFADHIGEGLAGGHLDTAPAKVSGIDAPVPQGAYEGGGGAPLAKVGTVKRPLLRTREQVRADKSADIQAANDANYPDWKRKQEILLGGRKEIKGMDVAARRAKSEQDFVTWLQKQDVRDRSAYTKSRKQFADSLLVSGDAESEDDAMIKAGELITQNYKAGVDLKETGADRNRAGVDLGYKNYGEHVRHDLAGESQGAERIGIMRQHLTLAQAVANDRLDQQTRVDAGKANQLAAQAERFQQAAEAIGSRTKYKDPQTGEEKESRKAQNERDKFAAQAQALRRQLFSTYGDLFDRGADGRIQMTTAQYRSMFPSLGGNYVGDAQSLGVQLTDADTTGQGTPVPSPMKRLAPRASRTPASAAPANPVGRVSRANFDKVRAQNPSLKGKSDAEVEAVLRAQGIEVY